ncbi:MAG: tryptophan 7-halogenase [Phycisphaerales bacterium]|nr:tryptophan 7-halogenase [Phycisphaerales bacterium]
MSDATFDYDVLIIGGGPAGSTTGGFLRKYNPDLRVLILERENFPRDHVGESQLPPIGRILDELGAWEKVEAAKFPIKIGASYTWGKTVDPWEFEFLPLGEVPEDNGRPEPYDGWRVKTALQVDRAVYDKILLDHAASLGCEVREGARVAKINHENGRVTSVVTEDSREITARYYVDASGNVAILRRALGVKVDAPTKLRNVSFWNYWQGASLNEDLFGHGVTRVQVRSVPFGWLWYIPLSEQRTSVGLVCPADYYKQSGRRPQELYDEAISLEPQISSLLEHASPEKELEGTTDWSFLADQACGDNWFLCGETLGFADPVLAAGLTLTHSCGRHCAYTLLELFRGELDSAWLKKEYGDLQCKKVIQHMRFAEYWYSANGCFSDLQAFCSEIAKDAGLKLSPTAAFRWLSNGGLDDEIGQAIIGGFDVAGLKQVQWRFSEESKEVEYLISGKNVFKLNLQNAKKIKIPVLKDGRIRQADGYERQGKILARTGAYELIIEALEAHSDVEKIVQHLKTRLYGAASADGAFALQQAMQALEVMVSDYWVFASVNKKKPVLNMHTPKEGQYIYTTALGAPKSEGAGAA